MARKKRPAKRTVHERMAKSRQLRAREALTTIKTALKYWAALRG